MSKKQSAHIAHSAAEPSGNTGWLFDEEGSILAALKLKGGCQFCAEFKVSSDLQLSSLNEYLCDNSCHPSRTFRPDSPALVYRLLIAADIAEKTLRELTTGRLRQDADRLRAVLNEFTAAQGADA